ncbi:Thiol-disulfide isomerase or thioredoxin [Bryocella elongata]|uniref:Thiol-disulfide isomerase or thioredoxin n=1 Tax=Bryocella elongata TaxID=863522 RepID=A0A1H6BFW9_9BACT|nr:TlpA disulfide reductase family protein [Bryocella elongata]SEG59671.1 Thiol-disulfide isomerase or thioredoxin [Bryocella elongata]
MSLTRFLPFVFFLGSVALSAQTAVDAGAVPPAPAKAAASAPAATAAPALPVYAQDPKFLDILRKAKAELAHRQILQANEDYKKVVKLSGGQCAACLMGLYDTQVAMGEWKDAVATATTLVQVSPSVDGKAAAQVMRGQALVGQGGEKPKPAQLAAAHEAFQAAIALEPKSAAALYGDGRVLARMNRMDEAKTSFEQCAACVSPKDPARLRAQHFAADPELSLHKMAPPFEVTSLDGAKFNLDAMGGRVVLIDFWATWCGPCNEELPHMKKIAKEFAGQPLVILSVSWDADEAKWKQFLVKNEMTWVQYRDADHKLSDAFGINAIPHYFTIDSDGVLTAEMVGSGSDVEGRLKKLLAKAREAHPATTSGVASAAGQ